MKYPNKTQNCNAMHVANTFSLNEHVKLTFVAKLQNRFLLPDLICSNDYQRSDYLASIDKSIFLYLFFHLFLLLSITLMILAYMLAYIKSIVAT